MRRRPLATTLAAGLLLAGASLGVAARPAAADDIAEPFVVGANQTVTKTLGPIIVSNTVTTQLNDPTPSECAMLPSCNLVHFKFPRPEGYTDKDTFLATIEISFTKLQVNSGNATVGNVAASDIDAYLYPDPTDEDADSAGELDHNASTDNPFQFSIDVTTGEAFQVAVNNATGVQQSYTVKATALYIPFVAPFESLDPDIAPPTIDDGSIPTASSDPSSAAGSTSSSTGTGTVRTGVGLAPSIGGESAASTFPGAATTVDTPAATTDATVDPGSALANGVDSLDPGLEAVLGNNLNDLFDSGGGGKRSLLKKAAVTGPPKPVKAAVLLLWLLGLPLVLGSLAAGIIRRRRPAAMSMSVPTGGGGGPTPA